jgi:hypothetical protein
LCQAPSGAHAWCREQGSCSGSTPYYHHQTSGWCCVLWTCYCSYCCDYPRYRPSPPPPVYTPPPSSCSGTWSYSSSTGSINDGSSTYSSYTNDLDCRWLIQPGYSGIKLDFLRFRTEPNHDTVLVYDGSYTSSTLIGNYSGTTVPDTVTTAGSSLLVRFTTDGSIVDTGFAVSYQRDVPAASCSGTTYLTSSTGGFTDGSSTSAQYTNGLDCRWLIRPGYSGIELSFSRFRTENTYDRVYVYDGSTTGATVLGSFTGTSLPSNVVSNSSSLLVRFVTDTASTSTGFYATYQKLATTCTGQVHLTSSTGTFTDGSVADMPYFNNKECSWLIEPGYSDGPIRLSFSRFRTQSGYDFVRVYSGSVAQADKLIASLSGTTTPSAITTPARLSALDEEHAMLVVFETSSSTTDTGFQASYRKGDHTCWGTTTLTSATGFLTDSSNTGSPYSRGVACTWLISPGYSGIRLELSRLSVLGPGDELSFYSSSNVSTAGHLGTVSDLETMGWVADDRVVVRSPTTQLLVTLTSSLDSETTWSTGFDGEYSADSGAGCSGRTTLTASSGSFTDGSVVSDLYPSFLNCSWLIAPANGGLVRLSFLRLDTEGSADVVQVYDGPGGALIGAYSGSNPPTESIASSASSLLVTFTSDSHGSGQGFELAYSVPCQAADGSVLYEGDTAETTLYTRSRAPFGETCAQFAYITRVVCRGGELVASDDDSGSGASAYTSCTVEQCIEQSIHMQQEGWLADNLNYVPGSAPQLYQSDLECGWMIWVGGSASSALSLSRRSVQYNTAMETALTFKRLNTVAGRDVVRVYAATPSSFATLPVSGDLLAERSGDVPGLPIFVTGVPAVEITFTTGESDGIFFSDGTGWELGFSSIPDSCSFKVTSARFSFRFWPYALLLDSCPFAAKLQSLLLTPVVYDSMTNDAGVPHQSERCSGGVLVQRVDGVCSGDAATKLCVLCVFRGGTDGGRRRRLRDFLQGVAHRRGTQARLCDARVCCALGRRYPRPRGRDAPVLRLRHRVTTSKAQHHGHDVFPRR